MNFGHQQIFFNKFKNFNFSRAYFVFVLLSNLCLTFFSGTLFATEVAAEIKSKNTNEVASLGSVEDTSFNTFKIADYISFPASRKIYIEHVQASFSKNWINKFSRTTSRNYREKTLHKYAVTFRSHLDEILTSSGWTVLNAPEEGAMQVSAKLSNLHINAPEVLNMTHPLVLNIGRSDLEVSIFDADKNLALYIEDTGATGSPSDSFIETNKAINFNRFNKMFYGWANNLTIYLNMVSEISSTS